MHLWMVWIPLISAGMGWLINRLLTSMLFYPRRPVHFLGITFQGQLPQYQQQLSEKVGTWLMEAMPINEVKEKLSNAENLQKIMPRVEEHIDQFLKVRLPQAMPVVAMFVGEKTIGQLKAVFMTELETLFPAVMNEYVDQLGSEFDLKGSVTQKLAVLTAKDQGSAIRKMMAAQLRFIEAMGVVGGLVTGLLQVVMLLIFYK